MNKWPLVSVVTPSLNQGRFIRATIESVLVQDYPNLEYWVIDGASGDETVEILRSYGDRLRWISEPDEGQSQAVNKGWRRSNGDILGWLNADDLLEPSAVWSAVETLIANPTIGAVYGDTAYIDDFGKFIQSYPVRAYDYEALITETENYIPQPSVFMRRTVLEETGFLNESLHYLMDYDLWLRMGLIAPMEYMPTRLAALRLHATAKTVKAMPRFANEFVLIFQNLFSDPNLPRTLQEHQIDIMHAVYLHSASFCFWGGETKMALQFLKRAWELQPFPHRRTFWLLYAFSIFGKAGWRLAEILHGNPMQLKKGLLIR